MYVELLFRCETQLFVRAANYIEKPADAQKNDLINDWSGSFENQIKVG